MFVRWKHFTGTVWLQLLGRAVTVVLFRFWCLVWMFWLLPIEILLLSGRTTQPAIWSHWIQHQTRTTPTTTAIHILWEWIRSVRKVFKWALINKYHDQLYYGNERKLVILNYLTMYICIYHTPIWTSFSSTKFVKLVLQAI